MKREIKFRILAKTDNGIELIYLDKPSFYDNLIGLETSEHVSEYPTKELMQYAGFKDKKGNEVYEGDVLKYTYKDKRVRDVVCCFDKGSFIFRVKESNVVLTFFDAEKIEVIGNLYSNIT